MPVHTCALPLHTQKHGNMAQEHLRTSRMSETVSMKVPALKCDVPEHVLYHEQNEVTCICLCGV